MDIEQVESFFEFLHLVFGEAVALVGSGVEGNLVFRSHLALLHSQ